MRVAVLGVGPVGVGSAMLLASRGHQPVLSSPTGNGGTAAVALTAEGALQLSAPVTFAGNCEETVTTADAVLVVVPDILVQSRRNAKAAKRLFRKLLRGLQYVPRVIVTDKLRSYAAANREVLPGVEHRQSRYLDNRVEVSYQPTWRRERQMQRLKVARQAERFLSAHSCIQFRRYCLTADQHRAARNRAFSTWREAVGVASAT